ncbi:kynureninase [Acuticoccus mangrovi]|uniref:Kynureninase n=1 Tax=Acuticoccus mangrovi TaxID=2796142 RepID=A0A934IJP5_9HYPH|nr:kynureninase [Acuticoccus mangrovi]MBJ3777934.1 kynureninase [Acuticoccus mangrovi]
MSAATRAEAAALDAADPLAHHRAAFDLPDVIYLDGNSLGPLTRAARERVATVVGEEWGEGLIRSWNTAGWVDLPTRVAAKIAPLIGAAPRDVIVTDSTSVNLFKVLSAALSEALPGRRTILSEPGNFPTDLYIAEGVAAGEGAALALSDDPLAALDESVAVLMLTEVDYRTGRRHDMARVTAAAHRVGALTVWDLAHSAGALPVDLAGAGADFAVGCGYKYLNGGPGAPAFLYVAPQHQDATQPLSGWFGHAAPFAFEPAYQPAAGIERFLTGTPSVIAMSALDAALDVFADVDLTAVAAKSAALADLMIARVDALCGDHLTLASPRSAATRGSQVSFRHPSGYPVMQALIAAGVIGDFRAPDILRFGFTPLYTRFVDVFDAVDILADILAARRWDAPQFHRRAAVT